MKNFLSLIYKIIWTIEFRLVNYLHTASVRIRLWLSGTNMGKNISSQGKGSVDLRISRAAKSIEVGNNIVFNNRNDAGWNSCCSIWVKENASLRIGDNSGFNGVLIYAANSVKIGNNVKVGGGSRIFDTDFHPLSYQERRVTSLGTKTAPIVIEDFYWCWLYDIKRGSYWCSFNYCCR